MKKFRPSLFLIFAKKIQKRAAEIGLATMQKSCYFRMSVPNEEIPYKNSQDLGKFFCTKNIPIIFRVLRIHVQTKNKDLVCAKNQYMRTIQKQELGMCKKSRKHMRIIQKS